MLPAKQALPNEPKAGNHMFSLTRRRDDGFTLVEMVAVLTLMGIVAATVLGRAIGTERIDVAGQMDRIRNQFRYAQTMAMKFGEPEKVWGFRCAGTMPKEYWVFQLDVPVADPVNDPNLPGNLRRLPGESDLKVNLTGRGLDMVAFTIFFDKFGRPYTSYTDETTNTPLPNPTSISVSAGSEVRSFLITPETGLIQ
jgi:prepilin-type N-terminal cleavage/methylation domain-containing protein